MKKGDLVTWEPVGGKKHLRGRLIEPCGGVNGGYWLVRTEDGRHILLAPPSMRSIEEDGGDETDD